MATFRKLPSGNWQARVSFDGKERSVGTFRTKKEARFEAGKMEQFNFLSKRRQLGRIYELRELVKKSILTEEEFTVLLAYYDLKKS